jgi:hypothetical protein
MWCKYVFRAPDQGNSPDEAEEASGSVLAQASQAERLAG